MRTSTLDKPLELLSAQTIETLLAPRSKERLGRLEILDWVDSTNSHLLREAATAGSGFACLAECQTAGRGRQGRSWQTPYGGGIALSVLWRFESHAAFAGLSLAVGVAMVRALDRAGVEGVGLKWPNDLLWQGRKLGGILLEVSVQADGCCAVVVGTGLNVCVPEATGGAIDQAWVDLEQITGGAAPSRNHLAALLLDELLQLLGDYPLRGLEPYLDEWRHYHCFDGLKIALHMGHNVVKGIVAGVTAEGLLVVDCEQGVRRTFASGDVRLRLDG